MNISKIACAVALVLGSSQLLADDQSAQAVSGSQSGASAGSLSQSSSSAGGGSGTGVGYGGTGLGVGYGGTGVGLGGAGGAAKSGSISGATGGSASLSGLSSQSGASSAQTGASSAQTGASSAQTGASSAQSGGSTSSTGSSGASTSFNYSSNVTDNSRTNYDLSKSVPSMWAPGLGGGGSNPCVVSLSAAGVGSGFGFSIGKSYNDKECQVREHLRVVGGQLQQGSQQAQVFQKNVACQSDMLRESLEVSARESGQPSMRCAASFYPGGRYPEDRNRRASKPAPRSVASAPASKGGYIEAVNRCKSVPDSAFASCMRQARSKL